MSSVTIDLILLPIWPYGGAGGGGGRGRKITRAFGLVSPHFEPFTCYCGAEKNNVFLISYYDSR